MIGFMDRDVSEFNLAIGFTNQLSMMMWGASVARMSDDSFGWYKYLNALADALSPYMKKEELETSNGFMNSINEKLYSHTKKNNLIPYELYIELHTYSIFLRKILKESGFLGKMIDDATKALR